MIRERRHTSENPQVGKPWVVVLVDDTAFKVEALYHAISFDDATGTVDDLDDVTLTTKTVLIVRDRDLVRTLVTERRKQAARMESAFKFD